MRRLTLALLAIALSFAVAVAGSMRPAHPPALLVQIADARPERAFAPRLSIATKYRPCTPVAATGTIPVETCGTPAETRLNLNTFAAAGAGFDPDSLQASALAEFIWWDETEASLNAVVSRLERALRLSPRPVPLLVDLSAVHLVRAGRTQNAQDLAAGLSYAREALSHQPANMDALYNEALALEALAVDEQAVRAWDAYLAADSTSQWADEVRRRRDALARSLASAHPPREPAPGASAAVVDAFAARHPQEARLLGWDRVLGKWGEAMVRGDASSAAQHLELAERLGTALEVRGGDASLADAARAIRAAGASPPATMALARGHQDYAAAQVLFRAAKFQEAAEVLVGVVRAQPPSSTLLQSTELLRAATLLNLRQFAGVDSILQMLSTRIDTKRHPALAARARWVQGTRLIREARYAEGQAEYRAARPIYHRLGETEHVGAMLTLESETANLQGDVASAYTSMHRALRTLRHYRNSVWLQNQLMVLADWAVLHDMRWAAPPIQDESVSVGMRTGKPLSAVQGLLARVNVRAAAGDTSRARADLGTAALLVEQITDKDSHDLATAVLRLSRTLVQHDKSSAIAALDTSIAYFSSEDATVWWLLRSLVRRAEVRLAASDSVGATADLDAFTARVRQLSHQEGNTLFRRAMIEQARRRFDQLVMLHLRAGRTVDALQALERGRVSFDPVHDAGALTSGPPTAPRGEVAVEYALIGDTLLAWTIRANSVSLQRTVVNRREFLRVAEQVSVGLEAPGGEAAAAPGLRRLYDWLIRPVKDRLGPVETPLVILADGEVAGIPFGALLDGPGSHYLVRDHPLRFAVTLADAARPRPARDPSPSVLLVADPAFDPLDHPTLDRLRHARAESHAIKALYPHSVLLDESAATREALTTGARSVRVIHYAGHAVFNDARPERSFLVLADTGTAGQLTAEAVASLQLRGVRLVVLSACRTLQSREGRSGGFAGFSGALLSAGAEGVVGGLWQVDDRRTQPLMVAFHRAYRESGDPAAALRRAQLEMLGSDNPSLASPATWAGFRYVGR